MVAVCNRRDAAPGPWRLVVTGSGSSPLSPFVDDTHPGDLLLEQFFQLEGVTDRVHNGVFQH